MNLAWIGYDLLMLSVVVQAARYRGPRTGEDDTVIELTDAAGRPP